MPDYTWIQTVLEKWGAKNKAYDSDVDGVFDLARIPSPLSGIELDPNEVLKGIWKHKVVCWFNNNWAPSGFIEYYLSGSAGIGWYTDYIWMKTDTTSASYAHICKCIVSGAHDLASWDKKRYFGVAVWFETYSQQYIHIASGAIKRDYVGTTLEHIGFKVIHDELYGTVADGSNESEVLLETLTSSGYKWLECIFYPNNKVEFYVNGVKKGELTTNLPSGIDNSHRLFQASIYNTESANKEMYIYKVYVYQEV